MRSRQWLVIHVAAQTVLRALVLVILYAVFVNTGSLAADGIVTKRGTALATACERVGPLSRSGLGWYWQCEGKITWQDGKQGTSTFTGSDLTPSNKTEPAPVAWREIRNRGHQITVEKPRPFVTFGRLMVVPLFGLAVFGARIPGVPPLPTDERTEYRRKRRLQLWQPLMIPVGWGLLVAGGLATAAPAVIPGMAVVTLVVAYVALIVMWALSRNRARKGFPEPTLLSSDSQSACLAGGHFLRVLGGLGVIFGGILGFGNWLGVLGVVAIPLALVTFGQRLLLVTNRHRRQFDGTVGNSAAS
ncbi:DUF6346 domain-containing protein [Saccharopolyspora halophila]|uniref:DUF6346 domain-containing protein n=1 Tax=Saccharopolyspora halophila TaxID=405551 RepID=UPI0031D3E960